METELLLERIDSLSVAAEAVREERDRLRTELIEVLDSLTLAVQERDRLRSDVSRLQRLLATGDTED
jgi:uncharacterized coiled-coil DUF342 family protein